MKKVSILLVLVISLFVSDFYAQTELTCNEMFLDSGGDSSSYLNSENTKWLICPDDSISILSIEFTYVDIETAIDGGVQNTGCKDFLSVYHGIDNTGELLGHYCGEQSGSGASAFYPENNLEVGKVIKNVGAGACFYIQFSSDNDQVRSGWMAEVTCCESTLTEGATDGYDIPIAENNSFFLNYDIDNSCQRDGNLSMISDFIPSGSGCDNIGMTLPNQTFIAFTSDEDGGLLNLDINPLANLGEMEAILYGPVTLTDDGYIGGGIYSCSIGEDPSPFFTNLGPDQTFILGVATEFQGLFQVYTNPETEALLQGILSVDLSSYEISLKNGHARLDWSTEKEVNNLGFEIFRADSNKNFESIGWVNGSQNEKGESYSFVDNLEGKNGDFYYYVIQHDLDGSTNKFDVLKLRYEPQTRLSNISVYPNPSSREGFYIETDLDSKSEALAVRIYNQFGETVLNYSITTERVLISDLPQGVYLISISDAKDVKTYKHIIF